jgi:hypothetical protein
MTFRKNSILLTLIWYITHQLSGQSKRAYAKSIIDGGQKKESINEAVSQKTYLISSNAIIGFAILKLATT